MKRQFLALLLGSAIALGTLDAIAQTVIRIQAIPIPNGDVNSKFRNGVDGSAAIPLSWATIPGFQNKPDGTAFSINVRTSYLTEAGSPSATLSLVGSVANWALAGDNLEYDGSGVSSGTLILRAERSGVTSDSLPFPVSSVALASTCIAGFTCAAVDGATCNFEDISGDQRITASGPGACIAYKTFSGEPNRHFVIQIPNDAVTNDPAFSGGGIFFAKGTNWSVDYRSQVWWPPNTPGVRCRTGINTPTLLGQVGVAATALPHYLGFEYTASSDDQTCWESENNSTYTQAGNTVDDGAVTTGVYGVFAIASDDITAPLLRMTFDIVSDTTTLSFGGTTPPPPSNFRVSNYDGGPSWASGVGQIINQVPTGTNSWQNWIGRQVDVYVAWSGCPLDGQGGGGWTDWEDTIECAQPVNALANLPPTTTLVLAYPMLPNDVDPSTPGNQNADGCGISTSAMWNDAAAGNYDSRVVTFAESLRAWYVSKRPNDPTGQFLALRWGWEMNGAWYAWSICNKHVQFKAYWERSIPIIRAELSAITIDFSPAMTYPRCSAGANCQPIVPLASFAPAASTWDIVTRSHHNSSPQVTSVANFNAVHVTTTTQISLNEVLALAVANGKKMGLTEWGTPMASATTCSPNHPPASQASGEAFIQGTYDFLSANAAQIGWDAYFSTSCGSLHNRPTEAPAIVFKNLWD